MTSGPVADPTGARSAHVVSLLRRDILDGTFLPGMPLREVALAGQYAVSRRTVREAVLVLSDQGLVVHRHNSGASVRAFDADDIKDLYRVRRMLECEGVRHAVSAPSQLLDDVSTALARLTSAVAAGGINTVELAEADATFHGAVIALSSSPRINDFYERIGSQMTHAITVMQRHDEAHAKSPESVVSEHRAIHDALSNGDAFEAQRLVLEHIALYEQVLLAAAPVEAHAARRRTRAHPAAHDESGRHPVLRDGSPRG